MNIQEQNCAAKKKLEWGCMCYEWLVLFAYSQPYTYAVSIVFGTVSHLYTFGENAFTLVFVLFG